MKDTKSFFDKQQWCHNKWFSTRVGKIVTIIKFKWPLIFSHLLQQAMDTHDQGLIFPDSLINRPIK